VTETSGPGDDTQPPVSQPLVDDRRAVHQGHASFYDSKGSGGNCSFPGAPANRLYVALGPSEYAAGAACGGSLDVTGPKGTVRVLITDQCPSCPAGKIDLSKEAFAKIADPGQGIASVSYRAAVSPPLPGPLTFRMQKGASQWWFAIQVGNHGNPLRSVEAKPAGGGWRMTKRQDYNYWLVDAGLGAGPYSIRVTDVYGQQAVVPDIRMIPEKLQKSEIYLYGADPTTAPTGSPSATPTPSSSPSPASSPSADPSAQPGDPVALAAAGGPASAAPVGCDS
jgi:expansin (peptidoglycan-binding protein)